MLCSMVYSIPPGIQHAMKSAAWAVIQPAIQHGIQPKKLQFNMLYISDIQPSDLFLGHAIQHCIELFCGYIPCYIAFWVLYTRAIWQFDLFLGHPISCFFSYTTQFFYDIPEKKCDMATKRCDMATTRYDIGGGLQQKVIYQWKAHFSRFGWAGFHGLAAPAPPAYNWQRICTSIVQVWPLRQCNMQLQQKIS